MPVYIAASEPSCSINISLPGNAIHESESVEVNCSIEYRGSWMPVVKCVPEVQGQHIVEETSSSSRRISYRQVMSAADIGDWTVIRCDTRFEYQEWNIPESDQIDRLTDTPQYHHTWRSTPIRVFNTTGNTDRPRSALHTRSTDRMFKSMQISLGDKINAKCNND